VPARTPLPAAEDPSILEADPNSVDAELGRAGAVAVHKRHVFDRIRENDPAYAQQLVNDLLLDAMIADQARKLGIELDDADLSNRLEADEKRLLAQVEKDLGQGVTLATYVERQFGIDIDEFRRWQRLTLARNLYRQYVVRFLALRVDRVQVRVLQTRDRATIDELARRIAEGADFATLALRHSEDDSRKEGGMLPPLRRDASHPIVARAFELQPGEVSPVVTLESPAGPRHYLIYCLKRMPGREVPFPEVRAELDREIATQPLSPSDFQAAYDQLRAASQVVPRGSHDR
jgi:parvulin-like peptidyl-prolyl isomerase